MLFVPVSSNQTAFFSNFAHEIGNLTLVIAFNFKTLQIIYVSLLHSYLFSFLFNHFLQFFLNFRACIIHISNLFFYVTYRILCISIFFIIELFHKLSPCLCKYWVRNLDLCLVSCFMFQVVSIETTTWNLKHN